MGTYGLENVIRMWGAGTLSADQTIGQILQFIRDDRVRMSEIERRVARGERATQSLEHSVKEEAQRRRSPRSAAEGERRGAASSAARNAPGECIL
jgi:hypothetical protein